MDELMATAAFYGSALLYPAVTEPLAAHLLLLSWRRPNRQLTVLLWPALIVLHVAGFLLMRHILGDVLIGPGALSCMLTPAASGTRLRPSSPALAGRRDDPHSTPATAHGGGARHNGPRSALKLSRTCRVLLPPLGKGGWWDWTASERETAYQQPAVETDLRARA
jgi:hypothetical protein